jgi:hypothetical protein
MNLHKYIHLIIIFAFIGNINITNANEELIPLKDLLKQQNLRSPIGKLKYLADFSLQCGSLFEAINEVIPNNNILIASINLQEGALIAKIMIKKTEQRNIKKEVENRTTYLKNKYSELLIKNNNINGDYIKGSEVLLNDEIMCKKFVPRFYKFLKSNSFTIRK